MPGIKVLIKGLNKIIEFPANTALHDIEKGIIGNWSNVEKISGLPMDQAAKAQRALNLGFIPDDKLSIAQEMKRLHPNVKSFITEKNGKAVLEKVVVDESSRSAGAGTKFMEDFLKLADEKGAMTTLSPSADFGGNKKRLEKFYKRFGFVENKGKNKDFSVSDTFLREPKKLAKSSGVIVGAISASNASASTEDQSATIERLDRALSGIPGALPFAEFASSINKSVFEALDFLGPNNINAVLNLSGSETRVPTFTGSLSNKNFIEPGLKRDIIQSSGGALGALLGP